MHASRSAYAGAKQALQPVSPQLALRQVGQEVLAERARATSFSWAKSLATWRAPLAAVSSAMVDVKSARSAVHALSMRTDRSCPRTLVSLIDVPSEWLKHDPPARKTVKSAANARFS